MEACATFNEEAWALIKIHADTINKQERNITKLTSLLKTQSKELKKLRAEIKLFKEYKDVYEGIETDFDNNLDFNKED